MSTSFTSRCYQPSGKTPLLGVLLFLLGGIAAAWGLGIVYTYAVEYIPNIYANVLATLGFAALLGWALSALAKRGKLRSPFKVGVLALLVAVLGLWLHWAFFCAFILDKNGDNFPLIPTYTRHLQSLDEICDTAQALLEKGHFTIGHSRAVTGIALGGIWIVEALIILVGTVWGARSQSKKPYSETLDRWAEAEKLPLFLPPLEDPTATKTALEADDLAPLLNVAPQSAPASVFASLTLHTVEDDPDCQFLTLTNVEITIDKKGKTARKSTDIVQYLRITPEQSQSLRNKFAPPVSPTAAP